MSEMQAAFPRFLFFTNENTKVTELSIYGLFSLVSRQWVFSALVKQIINYSWNRVRIRPSHWSREGDVAKREEMVEEKRPVQLFLECFVMKWCDNFFLPFFWRISE